MSISKDVFKIYTPNVTKARNIISDRLISIKDVLPAHEKYLILWDDTLPYLERPKEAILLASRIHRINRKKVNRIKQEKDKLLYYFKVGDLLCKYESMETFHHKKICLKLPITTIGTKKQRR